jgi:hypothetical protein
VAQVIAADGPASSYIGPGLPKRSPSPAMNSCRCPQLQAKAARIASAIGAEEQDVFLPRPTPRSARCARRHSSASALASA